MGRETKALMENRLKRRELGDRYVDMYKELHGLENHEVPMIVRLDALLSDKDEVEAKIVDLDAKLESTFDAELAQSEEQ